MHYILHHMHGLWFKQLLTDLNNQASNWDKSIKAVIGCQCLNFQPVSEILMHFVIEGKFIR